jgi:hypothetical protein
MLAAATALHRFNSDAQGLVVGDDIHRQIENLGTHLLLPA